MVVEDVVEVVADVVEVVAGGRVVVVVVVVGGRVVDVVAIVVVDGCVMVVVVVADGVQGLPSGGWICSLPRMTSPPSSMSGVGAVTLSVVGSAHATA